MKKQLLKLTGASILAFSLSFAIFMSLTVAIQDNHGKNDTTAIQTEQPYGDDTTLTSILH
ncbi:hypothetical protein CLNEO_22680 [Anaerotignum neopropionicum]|uniref:Uncharacterized protein n=1 Tax=Anaerotignum neopropionicum TaxID=36847 RepID=A0A136WCW1_9FIRM|nr:hypothetical protein [Anaerotignum neopropionicum]KXL52334.1 hypothetical protein CLNEO_22680 [Anaerotignum neopropionicum]